MPILRLAVAATLALVTSASAQSTVTFDTLAAGTAVTNQFPGVTFSLVGAAGTPTIGQTAAGVGNVNLTASGNRFLMGPPDGGTPATCQALRIDFATPQNHVSVRFGILSVVAAPPIDGHNLIFQAFDSGGVAVVSHPLTWLPASQSGHIDFTVNFNSATRNITRVQISARDHGGSTCRRCYIDDVVYCNGLNGEDPVVSLTSPADRACVCSNGLVTVMGTIDAGDCGGHASDRLEYRAASATAWTLVSGPFTSLPGGGDSFTGELYNWVIPPALLDGDYYLRCVCTNDGGRQGSDSILIRVDRSIPTYNAVTPVISPVLRGTVCITGQISDGPCGATHTAEYKPAASATYLPLPLGLGFPDLARWDTTGLADGAYHYRLTATDACGNANPFVRLVSVDNTAPTARIDLPLECSVVGGLVTVRGEIADAHLSGWTLAYTGGDASGWVTIATGNTPVASGGVIGTWNTAGLRACGYTLRLVASDNAATYCSTPDGPNTSEVMVSVDAGCAADFNHNGSVSVQDIFDFLAAYFAGCL